MTILRSGRAAFRFSGPDATRLLADVITGFVAPEPGPARWWALLSPQGKIQAEGLIGVDGEAYLLDVAADAADAFFKRMKMYRLRAKVEIEDLRETHRVGWQAEAPTPAEGLVAHEDPRAGGLGWRVIAPGALAEDWSTDEAPWHARRVAAAIAEMGPDFLPDSQFPHDLGMDLLDGIDFSKGCYVGQEVVSRMKHRGTARRRPVIVEASGLTPKDPVVAGGREAGRVGTIADGTALAIIRLDRVVDPEAVTAGSAPARLHLPSWASYRFGESAETE
ncbi:folate-binding protein [Arsenicitalea aurantiaca]|uniref:Folate-binding protein n=1 Tax=Arsenicitalea aurantiaca TaxID=1783274 RepID=A0A433XAM1_9HYPH|nr:folate-binding protein YgfZ [Arsenicitalea aurantiaca]RUT31129.1 folate-binding protein [Arsenicitalea aurantiaca]